MITGISAQTPKPPYWAVIFTSLRTETDDGYSDMAAKMAALATEHPGCLGLETFRNANGFGATISYWKDEKSISDWKADKAHLIAQQLGREKWYSHYRLRVCKVERSYGYDSF